MLTITVDHNSKEPPYKQIYDQIVSQISAGVLVMDDVLPPSRTLAGVLDVNFHTVNRSYQMLRENGIISLTRNRKYVVTAGRHDERSVSEFFSREQELISDALARGFGEDEIIDAINKILKTRSRNKKGDCRNV